MGRHDLQHVDGMLRAVIGHGLRIGRTLRGDHVQGAPAGERREHRRVPQIGGESGDGREARPGRQVETAADARDIIDERMVLHRDTFRRARGPRGVDHISQVPTRRAARQIGPTLPIERRGIAVQADHSRGVVRQRREQFPLSEQHRRPGIGQHEREPLAREAGIERDIGGTGLQDTQDADHQLERALHTERDARVRSDAQTLKMTRKLVGAGVQPGVQ